MKKTITLLLALFFLISCKNTQEPICNNPINPDSKIIWRMPLKPDTSYCYVQNPILIGNDVVFDLNQCASPAPIIRLNTLTGEEIWRNTVSSVTSITVCEDYFATNDWYEVNVGNVSTGEIIYTTQFQDGYLDGACAFSNMYFSTTSPRSAGVYWDTAYLMYSPLENEDWKVLASKVQIDGYRPAFLPPVEWVNPASGDEVVIFPLNRLKAPVDLEYDIYAYNITQDTLMWINEAVQSIVNEVTTLIPPVILNDKIYVQMSQSIICLDAATGVEIWQRYFPGESFFRTKNLFENGIVVLNSESSNMFGVDAETGELLWTQPDGGYGYYNMAYFEGLVYYSDGRRLEGIDIYTGEKKWEYLIEKDFLSNASFSSTILINKEHRLLLTTDHLYYMAIKLD